MDVNPGIACFLRSSTTSSELYACATTFRLASNKEAQAWFWAVFCDHRSPVKPQLRLNHVDLIEAANLDLICLDRDNVIWEGDGGYQVSCSAVLALPMHLPERKFVLISVTIGRRDP